MVNRYMSTALHLALTLPVSPRGKLVAMALIGRGLAACKQTGVGAARSTLCALTGLSKKGVDDGLAALEAAGLIAVLNRGQFLKEVGKRQTHRYDLRPLFRHFTGITYPAAPEQ